MSKVSTDRKPLFGNNRPFSLKATKKKQSLNKQKVTVNGKKVVTTNREAKKLRSA